MRAMADGADLEARGQVQDASILALDGSVNTGANGGYPAHMIEHPLSAFHDLTPAAGLSAIYPSWMRFAAKQEPRKFVRFTERIGGLEAKGTDDPDCAFEGIEDPTRLSKLGLDDSLITK